VHQMGGAIGRVGDSSTAFAERTMPYVLNSVAGWREPDDTESHRDWVRAVIAAGAEASTGRSYVNFLGDSDAARAAYGEATYRRLAELKRAYDPTNLFRRNQNIEPLAA
jgi:FAD/FMN-containing dehydrogenase